MIRHKDYLLAEVPIVAFGFDVNNYGSGSELMFMVAMGDIDPEFGDDETLITNKLPPGSWQLIGLASELEQDQWEEIFGSVLHAYEFFKENQLKEPTTVILKLIKQ